MKKFHLLLFAASLVLAACTKEHGNQSEEVSIQLNKTATLKHSQTGVLEPDGLKVTFLKVVEDSRCPLDAICVWEGRASVELEFSLDDNIILDTLQTAGKTSTQVFGRTVELIGVSPYPEVSFPPIPQEDYEVEIKVY